MSWKTTIPLILLVTNLAFPQEIIEREFDIPSGKKLEVNLKTGGTIDIAGWENEWVSALAHLDGRDCEDVEVDFREKSFGLSIYASHDGRPFRGDCEVGLDVHVPKQFDLDIKTTGGEIIIDGVDGEIEGKTMGGNLRLANLAGTVALTTMGGNISLQDSDTDGKVKTMGGNIVIENLKGNVAGSSMGGNVTYTNVSHRSGDEVSISTMGGNIKLDCRGGKIKAKTWGGNITAQGDELRVSTMGGNINVKVAPLGADVHTMGGDIDIDSAKEYVMAKTMGGDITVDEIDGWVTVSTMGGDVEVRMTGDPEKGKRDAELKSMGGDLSLTVPEGLSMDIDIELAYTQRSRQDFEIVTDFDIEIEETDEWERSRLIGTPKKYIYGKGVVAGGKNNIVLRTTNGDIYLKKERP